MHILVHVVPTIDGVLFIVVEELRVQTGWPVGNSNSYDVFYFLTPTQLVKGNPTKDRIQRLNPGPRKHKTLRARPVSFETEAPDIAMMFVV